MVSVKISRRPREGIGSWQSLRDCGQLQALWDRSSFAYFQDVLERISTQPACRIAELIPRNWKPLRS